MSLFAVTQVILGSPFAGQVIAFFLTLIGALVVYLFRARVRLVWARTNQFTHRVTSKPTTPPQDAGQSNEISAPPVPFQIITVHTATYIIQNMGRAVAHDVEFVLNYQPEEISIWGQRKYRVEQNPEGRPIICFEQFAPKEICSVNIITIGRELPMVLNVRCTEKLGRFVEVYPQQKFPKWVLVVLCLLVLVGVYFVLERVTGAVLVLVSLVPRP